MNKEYILFLLEKIFSNIEKIQQSQFWTQLLVFLKEGYKLLALSIQLIGNFLKNFRF